MLSKPIKSLPNPPQVTVSKLLEVGAQFGQNKKAWNPSARSYIYGSQAGVHLIDLEKTVFLFNQALRFIHNIIVNRGRILLICSKLDKSFDPVVSNLLKDWPEFYVKRKWLSGTITNWNSIFPVLANLEDSKGLEVRKLARLDRFYGGMKGMKAIPDLLIVLDANKNQSAILEANKMNIPVVSLVDTDSDTSLITYPIPINSNSARALEFYCQLILKTVNGAKRL